MDPCAAHLAVGALAACAPSAPVTQPMMRIPIIYRKNRRCSCIPTFFVMISTKGRYALQVMLDLAQQCPDAYISLHDISQRQAVSMKYLEAIVAMLNKAGMVESRRGKSGGYRLTRAPEDYTVGAILKLTEGTLAPVACMDCDSPGARLYDPPHVAGAGPVD